MLGLDLNNLVMVRALVLFPPWLSTLLLLQRVVRMLAFEMGGKSGYFIYTDVDSVAFTFVFVAGET